MQAGEFTQELKELLNSITEVIRDKSINVISTSINEDITIDMVEEGFVDKKNINKNIGNSFVMITFKYKEGFLGENYLIITKPTVAQIVDKMLMGEGDADFDPDEHLEAIQELMDQILGAVSTDFTGTFNFSVSFEGSTASVIEYSEFDEMFTAEDFSTHYYVNVLDKSSVFIIIPNKTFSMIVEKVIYSDDDPSIKPVDDALHTTEIGTNMMGDVSSGKDLGALMDVRLPISVELGRKNMFIRDILKLTPGEVVDLPKLQGEPIDLYVNNIKFATGEVVVIGENFGIRIKNLIEPHERLKENEAWVDDLRVKQATE